MIRYSICLLFITVVELNVIGLEFPESSMNEREIKTDQDVLAFGPRI